MSVLKLIADKIVLIDLVLMLLFVLKWIAEEIVPLFGINNLCVRVDIDS